MQVSNDNQERAAKEKHLIALQKHLEELRAECSKIERDCARLQYELGHPVAPISSRSQTAVDRVSASRSIQSTNFPIHRCPNEILVYIFDYSLDGFYHPYIRRLVLVCKRWHWLIMNTKSLWSRIEIDTPLDLLGFPTKSSLVPYMNACFERSGDLTLDVKLELSDLPTLNEYISIYLCNCGTSIVNRSDQYRILDKLDGINWKCGSQWYESQHKAILNSLFGSHLERLSRFRTLDLRLPCGDNEAGAIAEKLGGPFPNLKYLQVYNIYRPFSFRFSSFPSVETIILKESVVPLKELIASSTSLRHLEIGVEKHLFNIAELSAFTQLRKLVLHFHFFGSNVAIFETCRVSVDLPYLHDLTIAGDYPQLHTIDFKLPRLELLKLEVEMPFSGLSKLHPHRIVLQIGLENEPFMEEIEAMLRNILMLSTTTQSITVPDFLIGCLGNLLTEFRKKNAIPSLTQITFISEHGNEETFNPHDDTQLARIIQCSR